MLGPSELTGKAVKSAVAQQDQVGAWVVNYTLTSTGSPEWDKVAQKNFHALLAIELDGVVQSAPLIQPDQATFTSFDGTGEISGSFTEASAKTLALAMNFGALPVRLEPLTTVTVSPTLGHSRSHRRTRGRTRRTGAGAALHHPLLPGSRSRHRARTRGHGVACCGRSSRRSAIPPLRRASTWRG